MSKTNVPRFPDHRECHTLTRLVSEHLVQDGSIGRVRRYRKGTEVWRPNDRADRIFFLQQGQVSVRMSNPKGHEFILQIVDAPAPFGELCFCAEKEGLRETSARADAESNAIEIKFGEFLRYLQGSYDALQAFLFTFCIRLVHLESHLGVLSQRTAEERLGQLLLHLATTRGAIEGQRTADISLSISHLALAQMAGMSRPHVSVTMGKFRRLKLVRYERGSPLWVAMSPLKSYLLNERPSD